jgi:hypothetical protein
MQYSVSLNLHNECLRVCHQCSNSLTDGERLSLNIVAGAYASHEPVSRDEHESARAIIAKFTAPAVGTRL